MAIPAQKTDELSIVSDNLKLVHLRDQGINIAHFSTLQSHARLSKSTLASYLGVDPTTIDNYRKRKKKLTGDSAEKLLKLHRLFALGEELFGTTNVFTDWLRMPSPGLEGR